MSFRDEVQAAQDRADAAERETARLLEEIEALRSGRTDAWSAAAGAVVFVGIGGNLVAMERAAGKVRWQTPLVGNGTVLVSWEHDVLLAATRGEIFRLSSETGDILWRNKLPGFGHGLPSLWTIGPGEVGAGTIVVGLKGKALAVETARGEIVWQTPLRGSSFVALTVVARDLFASTGGHLYCLDVTTGEPRWHDELRGLGIGLVCVGAGNLERAGLTLRHEEIGREQQATAGGAS